MNSITTNQTATDALFNAISPEGSLEEVKQLIEQKADVNARDVQTSYDRRLKATPLHRATHKGSADMMRALIAAQANVDAHDMSNRTPLEYAIRRKNARALGLLLDHKADPNLRTRNRHPLHLVLSEKAFVNMLQQLIAAKADVNVKTTDQLQFTPLHYAARMNLPEHTQALIDANADIDAFGAAVGFTPLHLANLSHGKLAAEVLVKNGANLRAKRDEDEVSAFFCLSEGLREGELVKRVDSVQQTALKLVSTLRLFIPGKVE